MTREYTGPDRGSLEALELLVSAQGLMIVRQGALLESIARRLFALQEILVAAGTVERATIEAHSQEIDLATLAEIELNPKYEEFRRQRDVIRRLMEEGESPET